MRPRDITTAKTPPLLVEGKYSIPQLIAVAENVVAKTAASSKLLSNSTCPNSMECIPTFFNTGACPYESMDV